MKTSRTVKNMSMAGLLILAVPTLIYTSGARKITSECNFTKTHLMTLELVKAQCSSKPSVIEEIDNCFLALFSDFKEIVRLVDPTVEPGPVYADYHETMKSMVMEDFNMILKNHGEKFKKIAHNLGEWTEVGKMLIKIAQALHDMGQVFVKHMAVGEELARKDKGPNYTKEDGIAAATTLFRMQKLKKDLQPYVFLMPSDMNDLSFVQWQKIIAALY